MDLRQSHVKTVGIDCQEGFVVCFAGLPGNNILLAAPLWRIFGSVLSIIVTSVVKFAQKWPALEIEAPGAWVGYFYSFTL